MRIVYACRTNIRVKAVSESHANSYSAGLATLFSTKRQMSVITLSAAIGQELPYRTVPEVEVMLGDGCREMFNVRPSLTMGELAQQAGPIELVIGRDYMQYWPRVVDRSRTAGDNLYLMKMLFHPGQLLYGAADKEVAEAMRKEARRRQTREVGESAGSSTSSSRRSRERISFSHSRDGERERQGGRSPSPRLTSSTTSSAQQLKASTL